MSIKIRLSGLNIGNLLSRVLILLLLAGLLSLHGTFASAPDELAAATDSAAAEQADSPAEQDPAVGADPAEAEEAAPDEGDAGEDSWNGADAAQTEEDPAEEDAPAEEDPLNEEGPAEAEEDALAEEESTEEELAEEEALPAPAAPAAMAGSASISGFLWVDGNGLLTTDWDGLYNGDEQPLAGYDVYLYEAGDLAAEIAVTQTDGGGVYMFAGLEPGFYVVGLAPATVDGIEYLLPLMITEECKFASDIAGGIASYTATIQLDEGQAAEHIGAGLRLPAGVMHVVNVYYLDSKGNSIGTPNSAAYNVPAGDTFTLNSATHVPEIPGFAYIKWKIGLSGAPQSGDFPEPLLSGADVIAGTDIYLIYQTTRIERYLVYKDTDMTKLLSYHHWLAAALNACGTDGAYTVIVTENDTDMADNLGSDPYGPIGAAYKNNAITIPATKSITLASDSYGLYTITMRSMARHLNVQGSLTLKNITLDGNQTAGGLTVSGVLAMNSGSTIQKCISVAPNAGYGGGIYVSASGKVTMNSGSTIRDNIATTNNTNTGYGGGLFIDGGTLTMNDGSTICGNTGNTGTKNGGGGGVWLNGGTLTLNNGSLIDGNFASAGNVASGNYATGGGVYVAAGTKAGLFTMNGGTISNNYAGYNSYGTGGGVYVVGNSSYKSTFNMLDGTVSDNITSRTSFGTAGGVYVGNYGAFNMSGGMITRNKASVDVGGGNGQGGGACVVGSGVFNMSGLAEISYNTGSMYGPGNGGGVLMENSSFSINGAAAIHHNMASTDDGKTGNGGGVHMSGSSTFTMAGEASLSNNSANTSGPGDGGGVYINGAGATFTITGGSLINNTAPLGDGGGIYTTDYDYKDPASSAKYVNIGIANAMVGGNKAAAKHAPPANAPDFATRKTRPFNGSLLDNNNINYRNPKPNTTITISTTVTGNFINKEKDFIFSAVFKDKDGNLLTTGTVFNYAGGIIPGSEADKPLDNTLTLVAGEDTFALKHGQTITIKDVPAGYQIQIVETEYVFYTVSYSESGGALIAGCDTGFSIVGTAAMTFEFFNAQADIPPSGIVDGAEGMTALLLLAVLLSLAGWAAGRVIRRAARAK